VKQMQDKQGFTMLELLICVFLISTLGCLFLPLTKPYDFKSEMFVLNALELQSLAMKEMEESSLFFDGYVLSYNLLGNISQAQRFDFKDHTVIAELGWGRLVER